MSGLHLVGCNHRTAPLDVREHIAFSSDNMDNGLDELNAIEGVEGGVIISTCNRTEICYTGSTSVDRVLGWLLEFHDFKTGSLGSYFYHHRGQEAMRHLVQVASGLDSMVLGEPQVLGQVKDAYKMAKKRGYLPGALDGAFQQVFAIAKKVRTDTRLGEKPLSLAAVVIDLAEKHLRTMVGRTALVVGAGDNASLIVRYLKDKSIGNVYIANRSHDKARQLAQTVGGHSIALMDIAKCLQSVDMVFTSTSSPTIIITKDMVAKAMDTREGKPLFVADLSVPRDVEPSVDELTGVSFFIMEDLRKLLRNNYRHRGKEARQAAAIISLCMDDRTRTRENKKAIMGKTLLRNSR